MMLSDWISVTLTLAGAAFFLAGTVGLLRFPDFFTRLHALTKADNVGLGLTTLALMPKAESWSARLELLLIWVLVLAAASVVAYLLGRTALERGLRPWRRP